MGNTHTYIYIYLWIINKHLYIYILYIAYISCISTHLRWFCLVRFFFTIPPSFEKTSPPRHKSITSSIPPKVVGRSGRWVVRWLDSDAIFVTQFDITSNEAIYGGTKKAVTFLQVQIFQSASSQLHSGNYNLEMENESFVGVFPIFLLKIRICHCYL